MDVTDGGVWCMKTCSDCGKSYANPATVPVAIEVLFHGSSSHEYWEVGIKLKEVREIVSGSLEHVRYTRLLIEKAFFSMKYSDSGNNLNFGEYSGWSFDYWLQ